METRRNLLNRFSFKKKLRNTPLIPSSPTSKKPKNWLERLLDEENYWLKANHMEDDGNLLDAVEFYIIDAIKSTNNNYIVKTALSCSCAADCLNKLGNKEDARKLYSLSASLYEKNADYKIKTTIRESVWSLEQAYNNLIMANQIVHAKKIYSRYRQLASKITPTFLFKEDTSVLTLKELPIKIEEEIDENSNKSMIDGNGYSDIQSVNKCVEYINKYLEHIDQNNNKDFKENDI